LGIADYFSLRSYKAFVSSCPADLEGLFVFPNVEMRLTVETRGGQGVNIHLLVSPEDPDHVARAEDQIRRLHFGVDGEDYPCSDDGLTRLGRRYLVDEPTAPSGKALAEGASQFKVAFDKLQELFKRSEWLQRNVLVAIAAGNDGLGGFSKDSSFWLLREEMARFADVIFSGQPNERQFWLNEDHLAKNGLHRKPCLNGSDAHELAKVLKPAEARLCWIKGDASFESLRQTLVEPERRVWVGAEPPTEAAGASTIKALRVEAAPWLKTTEIGLNSGLVTIIGAKGSGKTALADLLALAAEAQEEEPNPASFLQKARDLLQSLKADLAWTDGSESSAGVSDEWFWEQPRVQYLSQQFVERLSAADGLAEPLVAEIERVVFSAIPTDGRMETSSLAELREVLLDDCHLDVEYQRGVIRDQTGVLAVEHAVKESLKQRRANLDAAKRSLALLEDQLKRLPVDAGTEAKIAELSMVNRDLYQLQTLIAAGQRRVVALQGVISDVRRIETQASEAVTRLRTPNPDLLSPEVWESLSPTVPTTAYQAVKDFGDQTELEMKAYRENGLQSSSPVPARSLAILQAEKTRLDKELGEVDSRSKTRAQIDGQLPGAKQTVANAQKEVDWALGADVRRQAASEKRFNAYEAVFQALSTEQATLERLYQPLLARINEDPKLRKLSFTVGRVVDLDAWVSRGEGLFDLRSQPFMGRGALQGIAKEELLPAWRQGEPAGVRQALADFYEQYFVNEPRPTVAVGTTAADVGDWLFATSHIRVQYGIEYEGVPISRLSPGTRGIVLLTLYLGLDKWDCRPLVIDQPEENLDPSSVQADLVPFFRDAATRRQIIMVTHNANLVVNTDSDQVIVASSQRQATNALPDISYHSGGLEDPRIREDVCSLLEGGSEAFRKRAERYGVGILARVDSVEGGSTPRVGPSQTAGSA
jgi:energy-coupling factor transporter ATP-binding protein EcfA2